MLVTRPDGTLTHLVGAMGGDAQPQIISQLLARLLRSGQDPATAIAAPRLTLDAPAAGPFRLWWGDDLTVLVEVGRAAGMARGAWPARSPRAAHQVLRPGRGRAAPRSSRSERARRRHAAPGGGLGPPQPRRGRGRPLRRVGARSAHGVPVA